MVSFKTHLLDAMANIYVPWCIGKNEKLDTRRHILVEVLIFVENLVISLWAVKSGFGHEALDELKLKVLGVIWCCYGFYICLKMAFFVFLHPWSELIKTALSKKFCCEDENPINENEIKDIDGGEINKAQESKLSSFHLEFSFNSIRYICLLF